MSLQINTSFPQPFYVTQSLWMKPQVLHEALKTFLLTLAACHCLLLTSSLLACCSSECRYSASFQTRSRPSKQRERGSDETCCKSIFSDHFSHAGMNLFLSADVLHQRRLGKSQQSSVFIPGKSHLEARRISDRLSPHAVQDRSAEKRISSRDSQKGGRYTPPPPLIHMHPSISLFEAIMADRGDTKL